MLDPIQHYSSSCETGTYFLASCRASGETLPQGWLVGGIESLLVVESRTLKCGENGGGGFQFPGISA
jgi:hypothetical protein